MKVLDIGCGSGNHLKFLLKFGFKNITGIDGSESAINYCKKKFKKKITLKNIEFLKYNFGEKKFDLAIDRLSISHNNLSDINTIVNRIYKSLVPSGYFITFMFSDKHSEKKGGVKKLIFKNKMNTTEGVTSSFFNEKILIRLFHSFKIISINLIIDKNIYTKYIEAEYLLVLTKK